jgi:hypothetical protein
MANRRICRRFNEVPETHRCKVLIAEIKSIKFFVAYLHASMFAAGRLFIAETLEIESQMAILTGLKSKHLPSLEGVNGLLSCHPIKKTTMSREG